jgi:hypothetical protein
MAETSIPATEAPDTSAPVAVPDKTTQTGTPEVFTGSDIPAPEIAPEVSSEVHPEDSTITPEPAMQPESAASDAAAVQSAAAAEAPAPAPKDAASVIGVVPTLGAVVAPSVRSDKRTVLILAAIAVVLLIAIVVLYFLV